MLIANQQLCTTNEPRFHCSINDTTIAPAPAALSARYQTPSARSRRSASSA
jgi:hypothetical protein